MPETEILPLVDSLLLPVGLKPTAPQNAAGILDDPAVSELIPKAEHFVTTPTASPPDDPPLMKAGL